MTSFILSIGVNLLATHKTNQAYTYMVTTTTTAESSRGGGGGGGGGKALYYKLIERYMQIFSKETEDATYYIPTKLK